MPTPLKFLLASTVLVSFPLKRRAIAELGVSFVLFNSMGLSGHQLAIARAPRTPGELGIITCTTHFSIAWLVSTGDT